MTDKPIVEVDEEQVAQEIRQFRQMIQDEDRRSDDLAGLDQQFEALQQAYEYLRTAGPDVDAQAVMEKAIADAKTKVVNDDP